MGELHQGQFNSTIVTDTVTSRSKKGTTISFDDATTYKRDSVTLLPPNLSLNQGMIKGYCTNFAQGDNSLQRTFNLSSVADVQTGVVDYFHANPFRAFRGYVQIPNDNNYGAVGIENHDSLTTECHSNSYGGSNSSWNLTDGAHNSTFFGELG